MRCAIYGAGSLGTVLGAYMTKAGQPVELVNRNQAHIQALREKGSHIKGTVDLTVPVNAIFPEEMSGTYDVIFLMTKQLYNEETVTFLNDMLPLWNTVKKTLYPWREHYYGKKDPQRGEV